MKAASKPLMLGSAQGLLLFWLGPAGLVIAPCRLPEMLLMDIDPHVREGHSPQTKFLEKLPLNDNFAGDVVSQEPDHAIRDIEGDAGVVEDTCEREVNGGDGVMADIKGALVNMFAKKEAHMDGLGVVP
ncbi:hypothetical protein F5146DRAFT_1002236 [Armillaria mellea]|nr:hypothetical protein F5146DRAFT_1002236 [Armillaria mellea]